MASVAQPKPRRRGNVGKLAILMQMPVDIFIEMVSHLQPLDLLHLARVSKFLRILLLRPATGKAMWKRSIAAVAGLPTCPSYISEPAYVSLIFEHRCQRCWKAAITRVDYKTDIKTCNECLPIIAITHFELKGLVTNAELTALIPMIPSTTIRHKVYYRRLETLDLLARYRALRSDQDACDRLVNEEREYLSMRVDHADRLMNWKIDFERSKTKKEQDIIHQRQLSIFQELVDLGWDKENDIIPTFQTSFEFRCMVHQPRLLTPSIWKRLKPKLVVILEQSRARRLELTLEREMRSRIACRQREVSRHMGNIGKKLQKGKGYPECQTITNMSWNHAIPCDEYLFLLPTMASFIADNEVPVTEALWNDHITDIISDLIYYQMKSRDNLVRRAQKISPSPPIPLDRVQVDMELEILGQTDEANIAVLNKADCFFETTDMAGPRDFLSILQFHKPSHSSTATNPNNLLENICPDFHANSIARSLLQCSSIATWGLPPTHQAFIDQGDRFICLCCPEVLRTPLSWRHLVKHYCNEQEWFKIYDLTHSTVKNSHADPQAILLDSDTLAKLVAANSKDDDPEGDPEGQWMCPQCRYWERSLGVSTYKSMRKLEAHTRMKHGV